MELLPSIFQTGGLAILVMLSCLLPFCDSIHALFHDLNGTEASFDLIKTHACGTYNELHTLLEINMKLFSCLFLVVFAVRYLIIPRIQRIDNVLDRVHNGVHKLILETCNAAQEFVSGYITLSARLSRIKAVLAKSFTPEDCAVLSSFKVERDAQIEDQLKKLHATYHTINEQYIRLYDQTASSFDAFEKHYAELKAAGERAIELEEKWLAEKDQCMKLNGQIDAAQNVEGYQEELDATTEELDAKTEQLESKAEELEAKTKDLDTKTKEDTGLVDKLYGLTARNASLGKAASTIGDVVIIL
ncbi:hypothetical protein E8E11_000384 [Didymella keratinophila]|nr:hypothetical protein E8E11_000384 [Didymella keratinophila]